MILGRVSYIDCIVFLVFLAPQLLIHVGVWSTLVCVARAIPFLLFQFPFQLIKDRYLTRRELQSPFQQRASFFEDVVIRCVRYAFADIPTTVGRVFLSKDVALPFLRFRMLRHGYLRAPIYWREVNSNNVRGLWIITEPQTMPDIIIYYCHGGGFSIGSSYFYLEFLFGLIHLLRTSSTTKRFHNPAIFALEYTLVPDATHPTQFEETVAGYHYILSILPDPSRICLAGDSAGATLSLGLLLGLSRHQETPLRPGFAVLISPWVTLDPAPPQHHDSTTTTTTTTTKDDYLNPDNLRLYARQYVGPGPARLSLLQTDPIVSPGVCANDSWWRRAAPTHGLAVLYGADELLAPPTRAWIARLHHHARLPHLVIRAEPAALHAWPVVAMFLRHHPDDRLRGLRQIVGLIAQRMA